MIGLSKRVKAAGLLAVLLAAAAVPAAAQRIKDVAAIKGLRDNFLKGVGLVIGLANTGDGATPLSTRPYANMLKRLNLEVDARQIKSGNVALVMVTATLRPFQREGQRIDVTVSSMVDAKSLKGGTLLATPLQGPGYRDRTVYAVAAGALVVDSNPATATVPGGAVIEIEVKTRFVENGKITLVLNEPDFSTASEIARRIDENRDLFGETDPAVRLARALDASTVLVDIPARYRGDGGHVTFAARLERIQVRVHSEALVIINANIPNVVMTNDVRVSPCLISHKNLTLQVPGPNNPGRVVPFGGVDPSTPLQRILDGLNALGVSTEDLIAILRTLKQARKLHARLVVVK